jgi:hypothetical protein
VLWAHPKRTRPRSPIPAGCASSSPARRPRRRSGRHDARGPARRARGRHVRRCAGPSRRLAHARFDDLGGDSLAAGRVCARLSTARQRPVPVSRLLRHQSAHALAAWLRSHPADTVAAEVGSPSEVPLTWIQAGFLHQHLHAPADRAGHCMSIWLIDGPLDIALLTRAVAGTHERHEALRAERPTARVTQVAAPQPVPLGTADSESAAVAALRMELLKPFDITAGEIWRMAVVPFGRRPRRARLCRAPHRVRRMVGGRDRARPVRGLSRRPTSPGAHPGPGIGHPGGPPHRAAGHRRPIGLAGRGAP